MMKNIINELFITSNDAKDEVLDTVFDLWYGYGIWIATLIIAIIIGLTAMKLGTASKEERPEHLKRIKWGVVSLVIIVIFPIIINLIFQIVEQFGNN